MLKPASMPESSPILQRMVQLHEQLVQRMTLFRRPFLQKMGEPFHPDTLRSFKFMHARFRNLQKTGSAICRIGQAPDIPFGFQSRGLTANRGDIETEMIGQRLNAERSAGRQLMQEQIRGAFQYFQFFINT